jgi:hypothetical protein
MLECRRCPMAPSGAWSDPPPCKISFQRRRSENSYRSCAVETAISALAKPRPESLPGLSRSANPLKPREELAKFGGDRGPLLEEGRDIVNMIAARASSPAPPKLLPGAGRIASSSVTR